MKKTIEQKEKINEQYEDLFKRFDEISTLKVNEWKNYHLLGYFCKKYKEHYSLDYTFSFSSTPMKSVEIYNINKLTMMLSKDPEIIKNYIDWIFEEKVEIRKRKITSLGFLSYLSNVNEFKFKKVFNKNYSLTRASELPKQVIDILNEYQLEASTYGDLAFIYKTKDVKYKKVLSDISNVFDLNKLDEIV